MKSDRYQELKHASQLHQEPDWLTAQRLNAFDLIGQLKLPHMQRFAYENWPLTKQRNLVWQDSKEQMLDKQSTANLIQIGETKVQRKFDPRLDKKGVIFDDLFAVLKSRPELIKNYLMKQVIKYEENKLTAYHMAYMNCGYVLYLPSNCVINKPIEVDLVQDCTNKNAWIPHILIIAEKGSQVKIVQHLKTIGNEPNTANMVMEVIAKANSHIEISSLEELNKNTLFYFNRRANIAENAHVEWAIGLMNNCDTVGDLDSELIGEGSYANSKAIAITSGKQKVGFNNRVTNRGLHTTGLINQRGVLLDFSKLIFDGIGQIVHGAHGSNADQKNRVLMMSDEAKGDANPLLLIDENDVIAAHAASVGPVDKMQMYYLMSRGISYAKAQRLVIRGFLGAVIDAIPAKNVRQNMIEILERKLIREQNKQH